MTSISALRGRPGLVGSALAVLVLLVDRLFAHVSVYDLGLLLLVGGVLTGLWGRGDTRLAGVAAVVAGVGVLVGARVLAAIGWGVIPLLVVLLVLGLAGWFQQVSTGSGRPTEE